MICQPHSPGPTCSISADHHILKLCSIGSHVTSLCCFSPPPDQLSSPPLWACPVLLLLCTLKMLRVCLCVFGSPFPGSSCCPHRFSEMPTFMAELSPQQQACISSWMSYKHMLQMATCIISQTRLCAVSYPVNGITCLVTCARNL